MRSALHVTHTHTHTYGGMLSCVTEAGRGKGERDTLSLQAVEIVLVVLQASKDHVTTSCKNGVVLVWESGWLATARERRDELIWIGLVWESRWLATARERRVWS
jgi:hypothetical protein